MAFDTQAALKAGYSQQEIDDYVKTQQPQSLLQQAHGVASFLAPGNTNALDTAMQGPAPTNTNLPFFPRLAQAGLNGLAHTAQTAGALATAIPEDILTAMGLKGAQLLPTATKFALNPVKHTGQVLQSRATQAGKPTLDLLTKHLGEMGTPHPNLFQGTGLESGAEKQAKDYISHLFKKVEGSDLQGFNNQTKLPTFADILAERTNAGKMGYDNAGSVLSKGVAKNLQRAYSNILHEGVPGTKVPDKFLHFMHNFDNPYVRGGLVGLAGSSALGGIGNFVKGLFSNND